MTAQPTKSAMRATRLSRRLGGARGFVASIALHAVVFALLALALIQNPVFPNAPAMIVRLVTLHPQSAPAAPPPPRPAGTRAVAAPRTPVLPPAAAPASGAPALPLPPAAAPAPQPDLSKGLRTTLGCAHPDDYGLTAAEREACARQRDRANARTPSYAVPPWYPNDQARAADEAAARRATERDYDAAHIYQRQPGSAEHCDWFRCNMPGRP